MIFNEDFTVISLDVGTNILITKKKRSVILNLLLWSIFFRTRGMEFGSILLAIDNILLAALNVFLVLSVFFVKNRNINHGLQDDCNDCSDWSLVEVNEYW
jgi:hypothetical protein